MSLKRQRRFAKYDRDVVQVADEVRDLSRFVNAQIVAFRKILKKYKVRCTHHPAAAAAAAAATATAWHHRIHANVCPSRSPRNGQVPLP